MDAFQILVIVLSITLGILLVATIILIIALTKLTNQVRQITAKAEEIVDNVETVSNFFKKTAGPVAISSLISNIVNTVTKHNKKQRGDDE
jgi:hypothetical protein